MLKDYKCDDFKLSINQGFINFQIDNIDILTSCELEELLQYDKLITDKIMAINFEKSVLLKRKNLAVKNLDFVSVIGFSKKIDGIDVELASISQDIQNCLNKYTDLINLRLKSYNQLINDFANGKELRDLCNDGVYDIVVILYYRYNKICDFIIEAYKSKEFDLIDFFDKREIKDLLSMDYDNVKQKVGAVCGSKL